MNQAEIAKDLSRMGMLPECRAERAARMAERQRQRRRDKATGKGQFVKQTIQEINFKNYLQVCKNLRANSWTVD